MDNLEELQWKCQECEAVAPPTSYDYMMLLKHKKGHHIRLVNIKTGEILANTVREARLKGIDIPAKAGKPGEPPSGMEITEEGITFPVTLPPVVFTMFDAAKAAELVDEKENIDSWLFDCVRKRFELDYGLKFMLVPIKGKM